jgi:hypothetical protein
VRRASSCSSDRNGVVFETGFLGIVSFRARVPPRNANSDYSIPILVKRRNLSRLFPPGCPVLRLELWKGSGQRRLYAVIHFRTGLRRVKIGRVRGQSRLQGQSGKETTQDLDQGKPGGRHWAIYTHCSGRFSFQDRNAALCDDYIDDIPRRQTAGSN